MAGLLEGVRSQRPPGPRTSDGRALAAAPDEGLHGVTAGTPLQELEERSPYPGLRAFTEQDAAVFFGREDEVAALWARIRTRPLLAVIGPSGAGKTSFLRAGVLPARPDGLGGPRLHAGHRAAAQRSARRWRPS